MRTRHSVRAWFVVFALTLAGCADALPTEVPEREQRLITPDPVGWLGGGGEKGSAEMSSPGWSGGGRVNSSTSSSPGWVGGGGRTESADSTRS